ncbi:hypothetical protein, partial [Oceanivirga salmonicida]|uniref:hypothetical protein n=1 Tax=Oceanivirga salmonicida TaxID=1769291 RepID=UPI003FA3DBD0
MKEKLMTDIIQGMLPYLNNYEMKKLKEVLEYTFYQYKDEKTLKYFHEKTKDLFSSINSNKIQNK